MTRLARSLLPALSLIALLTAGCAELPAIPQESAATAVDLSQPVADQGAATIRQGPLKVTCYRDEVVVFEHGTIYRVYRPAGPDAGWSYETPDGLKYRGRIGENVNCVWR